MPATHGRRTPVLSRGLAPLQADPLGAGVVANNPADQQAVAQAIRQSPLFRLYQEMGQESLRTSQSIDHVIYGRYQAGQPYLLREEFDAVGQLAALATQAPQPAQQPNVTTH